MADLTFKWMRLIMVIAMALSFSACASDQNLPEPIDSPESGCTVSGTVRIAGGGPAISQQINLYDAPDAKNNCTNQNKHGRPL